MGATSYSCDARQLRATSLGYAQTHARDATVFKQNAIGRVNEGMDPAQISLRECRDSEVHPQAVPIILQLDITGSMGRIPAELIKGDLPHLMGHLIDGECPDAAILFIACGDLFNDSGPLQIGQFESGDAELDHWLTTTWLEGDGGGNRGESYSLGWLFALNMIETDAWDKRGQKGLFISIGDEPVHEEIPVPQLKRLFGAQYDKLTSGIEHDRHVIKSADVLELIKPKWNVHHIQVGNPRYDNHERSWSMLTEGYHEIGRSASVVDKVRDIIRAHMATLPEINREQTFDVVEPAAPVTPPNPVGAGTIPDPI